MTSPTRIVGGTYERIAVGVAVHHGKDKPSVNFCSALKEGNVLFNNALNTFYLRLYGVRHMVKDHSDSERKPAAATIS